MESSRDLALLFNLSDNELIELVAEMELIIESKALAESHEGAALCTDKAIAPLNK
jgi:hypothetical protein